MKISVTNDKPIYQWDTDRTVTVIGSAKKVFWVNKNDQFLITRVVDGVAKIPNILLMKSGTITCWVFNGTTDLAKTYASFPVYPEPYPIDYVYTDTETVSIEEIIGDAITAEAIIEAAEAVRDIAEGIRGENEADRIENENERIEEEYYRTIAETARVEAEAARAVYEDYDPDKDYEVGNKVADGGSSYYCKQPCKGIPTSNTDYWLCIAQAGEVLLTDLTAANISVADAGGIYTSPIKNVENILQEIGATRIKKYGVYFATGTNPGVRTFDAIGKVAGVGTDTETATNDFDNIYPWSARRRCCGTFDANGNFIVNAYKGEPGYIEDGTNGEVWVEHSLFFYKHTYTGDAEEITISAIQLPEFLPAPIFINADGTLRQKAYIAAFPMSTVGGKATSRAGVFSDVCSLDTAMTTARTLGENYTVTTTAEWYTECLYMWVEFGTRHVQAIMNGASTMPYNATHTAVITETGVNRVVLTNANAGQYVIGQTILIGTSLGTSNIVNNRIITAIETYDADNKSIIFDGTAVNIAVGNIVCTSAWINGSCNSVLSSSGSPVSNSDGKHNCVYRGKETPYGNAFEFISDVLVKREGLGTTESPYTYDIYFLSDPTKYAAGAITEDYTKLNFQLPIADGYVKKLGFDSRFPCLRIPQQAGASNITYYGDYYYYPRDAISAARVGGSWSYGSSDGPCYWYCSYAPSYSHVYFRARLSYYRT